MTIVVGGSIIPSPTPGAADFHLFLTHDNSSYQSFLYLPVSAEPGFSTDLIRIDRLPRSPLSLDSILERWLTGYRQFAAYVEVQLDLLEKSNHELLFHAGFRNHPITGSHHTAFRYLRTDSNDYGIQFVTKLVPLTQPEIEARIGFLRTCELSPEALSGALPDQTDYARKAQGYSEEIYRFALNIVKTKIQGPIEELRSMLARASPLHYAEYWANSARYVARNTLEEGRIDELGTAVRYLQHALLTLYDERDNPFFAAALVDTVADLAELLMYTHTTARRKNLITAVSLFRFASAAWRPAQREKALIADVMAAFGLSLNQADSTAPLDSGLSADGRQDLMQKQSVLEAVDSLLGYAQRLAYIARRKENLLFKDACLAADLAQLLLERAASEGILEFNDLLGSLTDAFKHQLAAQMGLYGFRQEELDRSIEAFTARYRQQQVTPPGLVFLRPLCTSRRIQLKNQFGAQYQDLFSVIGNAPAYLTLEGALHLAFMKRFKTTALGGPIDILGMARPTAVFEEKESALRTWQKAASMLIAGSQVVIVLLEESKGLLWEMSEIARQREFAKTLFVSPPNETDRVSGAFPAVSAKKLREIGFNLPADLRESGFFLVDSSGNLEKSLDFDALWTGELLNAVWKRAQVDK